jgi:pilus assembly protein CpaE
MALPRIAPPSAHAPEFLALVRDDITRENLRQVAAQLGWSKVMVRTGGVAEAEALLAAGPAPAVLLVDVSGSVDPATALDGLADVCPPETRVVAIGDLNDVALYRRLMELGVADYLVKPVPAPLLCAALQQAQRTDLPAPARKIPARTLALLGARGGVGVTSLAASIGWGLANDQGLRTVLLDLDLQQGAMALGLDIEPGRGLRELLSAPERIDSLLIGSASAQQGERLRVLAAEEPLDQPIDLGPQGLDALLGALAETADAVVIDLPRRLDALGRGALAAADAVAIVTDLSLPGLRDTQRLLKLIAALRPDGETLVIANRIGVVPGEVPQAEFERGIGRSIDFVVPADVKAATAAAEQGSTLLAVAKPGPAAVELRRLVSRVAGGAAPQDPAAPTSLLKRLLGR